MRTLLGGEGAGVRDSREPRWAKLDSGQVQTRAPRPKDSPSSGSPGEGRQDAVGALMDLAGSKSCIRPAAGGA